MGRQEEMLAMLEKRRADFVAEVKAALEKEGYTVEMSNTPWNGPAIYRVSGITVDFRIQFDRPGSYHSRAYNGKMRMFMEGHSYPEPKNGFELAQTIHRIKEVMDAERMKRATTERMNDRKNAMRNLFEGTVEAITGKKPERYDVSANVKSGRIDCGIAPHGVNTVALTVVADAGSVAEILAFIRERFPVEPVTTEIGKPETATA